MKIARSYLQGPLTPSLRDLPALLSRLAGVLLLLGVASPTDVSAQVGAACPGGSTPQVLVQTASFPGGGGTALVDWGVPVPEVLDVPKFQTSLGTLLQVELVARARTNGDLCVDNAQATCCLIDFRPQMQAFIDPQGILAGVPPIVFDVNVTLFSPGFALGASDGIADCFNPSGPPSLGDCTPGEDHVLEVWDELIVSGTTVLNDPIELGSWMQSTGGPTQFVSFDARSFGVINGGGCPSLDLVTRISSGVELEVTYTYCATAPSTPYCFCTTSGPCGNDGGPGEGCLNGGGQGGVLTATGTTSLSAADLVLRASRLQAGKPGLFFQGNGTQSGGAGIPFGDGLRCVAGSIVRLDLQISGFLGQMISTVDLAAASGASPGDSRFYQLWYRDGPASPCGNDFNLTNGLEVVWTP